MEYVHQEVDSCCLKMNSCKDSHLVGWLGEYQTNLYQNNQEQSFTKQIYISLFHKYLTFGKLGLKVHYERIQFVADDQYSSNIVAVMLTEITSWEIALDNVLSMCVLEWLVSLVGCKIYRINEFDARETKNSLVCWWSL